MEPEVQVIPDKPNLQGKVLSFVLLMTLTRIITGKVHPEPLEPMDTAKLTESIQETVKTMFPREALAVTMAVGQELVELMQVLLAFKPTPVEEVAPATPPLEAAETD